MKKYLYLVIILFISCSAQEEVVNNNLEIENIEKETEMNEDKVYTSVP